MKIPKNFEDSFIRSLQPEAPKKHGKSGVKVTRSFLKSSAVKRWKSEISGRLPFPYVSGTGFVSVPFAPVTRIVSPHVEQ